MSAPGPERRFRTSPDLPSPRPIDLGDLLTVDVVRNAGDPDDDPFDPPNDWRLVVDGHGGDPAIRGLPADGHAGIHRLASYDGPNAVRITAAERGGIRITIPRGRYQSIALLGASGNGSATMVASIRYADDSVDRVTWTCPDWFASGEAEIREGYISPFAVVDRMDRIGGEGVEIRGEARLFEYQLPCDVDREVVELIVHAAGARFDDVTTVANLMAVTGMAR